MTDRLLNDIRIRNLDSEIAAALDRLAESDGRTVEAYLRELIKDGVRTRIRDFPTAAEWDRAGFGEVRELQTGRQYLACAGNRRFRLTLARSITGEHPEWNTEIEEARVVAAADQRIEVWARAAYLATRLRGDTPAMALREAMRWVAEHAHVDPVSRPHSDVRGVSPRFGAIIDALDAYIPTRYKAYPRDKMVIYHTAAFDIYLNEVDEKRGALMVYRIGEDWSITDGRADYFPLTPTAVKTIVERLCELHVLPLAVLEQL